MAELRLAAAAAWCLLAVTATGAAAAPPSVARYPVAVSFLDARHGLAVFQSKGLGTRWVATTSDGGARWRMVSQTDVQALDAVRGSRTVWAATRHAVVVSADGGRHWRVTRRGPVVALSFATARDGWIVAGDSPFQPGLRLLSTDDGGRTWQRLPGPCSRFGWPGPVALETAATGWVVCVDEPGAGEQGKEIWSTSDGGRTWQLHTRTTGPGGPPPGPVGDFPVSGYPAGAAAVGDEVWVWQARGGLEESRGGRHWRLDHVTSPEVREAVSVSLVAPRLAFAIVGAPAGDPGKLVRTTDGGRTWITVSRWR
jgi:photosystem II stability/assembly factor-like uncharacterized protein